MRCKNCDQVVDGNFCTHCGQKTKVDKINLPNFLNEVSETVFQVNRGLFYTIKELFVRPGHCIREYLSGKRKYHYKPIAYAFTLSAIYFLISKLTTGETFVSDFIEGFSVYESEDRSMERLTYLNWFAENYAFTVLLLLPLYSLASYLAFLKSGFNYLEHFVLNAYITGQQAIIYSAFAIIASIISDSDIVALITICISVAYAFIVFWQFFFKQSRVAVVFRSILAYAIYLILLVIIIFIFFLFTLKVLPLVQ